MTASTHEAKLSQLQARVVAIDSDLKELDDQYLELAGRFDSQDKHLLQQAEQIEERGNRLRRERAVCLAAAGQVEQQRQQEVAAAVEAEKRKQLLAAKQLAGAVMAANTAIDQAMVQLREQFAARTTASESSIRLSSTNC
jgi:hypothetical protein